MTTVAIRAARRDRARRLHRAGHSHTEIAARIGVSPATVKRDLAFRPPGKSPLPEPKRPQLEPDGDWRRLAACRDVDPELFFPDSDGRESIRANARARRVCQDCPVMLRCRQWALDNRITYGMWGGLSKHQRRELIAATRKAAATAPTT